MAYRYFKHDMDACDDEKLKLLIKDLGFEGLGAYWYIIEFLYKNNGKMNENFIKIFQKRFKISQKSLKMVLENYGLFYKTDEDYSSNRVDSGLVEMFEKSNKARASVLKRKDRKPTNVDTNVDNGRSYYKDKDKDKDIYIATNVQLTPGQMMQKWKNEIQEILDYLNKISGKKYTIHDGGCQSIAQRLEEGFIIKQFQSVIDIKHRQWANTDKASNLRPLTLFDSKYFQGYLNENTTTERQYL